MNPEKRRELLEMAAEDARVRNALIETGELFEGYHPQMEAVHLEHAARLEKMIDETGWPGRSQVGEDGAEAAWLIVQHAISLPEFSRRCLRLIQEAVAKGEAEAYQMAYLQDRINCFEGKPQRYGTQSDWNADGLMQVCTLEDEAKVNEYRAEIGLKPLERLIWKPDEANFEAPLDFEKRKAESEAWAKKVGWR